jgi:hypothetical protein
MARSAARGSTQSCRGHAIFPVRTAALGKKDCRESAQHQSIRSSFNPELSHLVEMTARNDHERTENNVYEDAAHNLLDSVKFLPCSLRKLTEVFGLTTSKSW